MEAILNREKKEALVVSVLYLYGGRADAALALRVAADIQRAWNGANGSIRRNEAEYRVKFSVSGRYISAAEAWLRTRANMSKRNLFVRVEDRTNSMMDGVSYWDMDGNTGEFRHSDIIPADSTTAAHEYGHGMGLQHPGVLDIRGKGVPGMMYPRGTLVDSNYQWDPDARAGEQGGTINPGTRRVSREEVAMLGLEKKPFTREREQLGRISNIFHRHHR